MSNLILSKTKMNHTNLNTILPYITSVDLQTLVQNGPFKFYRRGADDICVLEIVGETVLIDFTISEDYSISFENGVKNFLQKNKPKDGKYLYNIVDHAIVYDFITREIYEDKLVSSFPWKSEKEFPPINCLIFDKHNLPYRLYRGGREDARLFVGYLANKTFCVNPDNISDFGISLAIDCLAEDKQLPVIPITTVEKHVNLNVTLFSVIRSDVPKIPSRLLTKFNSLWIAENERKEILLSELERNKFNMEGEFTVILDFKGFPYRTDKNIRAYFKDKKLEIIAPSSSSIGVISSFIKDTLGYNNFTVNERSH